MKIKHYAVSLLLAVAPWSNMFGQTPLPEWRILGNSFTNPSTHYVGTADNVSLVFRTNAIERMRLTTGGSLAIGATSASSTLHVAGTAGEIFRTVGPTSASNVWRMIMGADEKFLIGSYNDGIAVDFYNDVFLQTSSADDETSAGNLFFRTGGNGTGFTRMRINGVYNGTGDTQYSINGYNNATYGVNSTGYVAISSSPTSSLFSATSGPYSLLHLNSIQSPDGEGYRPWMKTGVNFTENEDFGYVGNRIVNGTTELNEFVMAWGNDSPSHDDMVFRFITGGEGDASGDVVGDPDLTTDLDGLNIARFTPSGDLAIGPNFGYDDMNVYTGPTERIDAEGNARLRLLPDGAYEADGTVTKSVFVDADGTLMWKESYNIAPCSDATGGALADDAKIDLNDNSFYFTNQGDVDENMVIIGYDCGDVLTFPAKLTVYQNTASEVAKGTIAGSFLNQDIANEALKTFRGIYAESSGNQEENVTHVGGEFRATGARLNYGVKSLAEGDDATISYGGHFKATDATTTNFGIWAEAVYNGVTAGTNRAGYFAGQTETTAGAMITSDQKFKQNVSKEKGALELLSRLRPVTYDMKMKEFPQFNFSDKKQHGIIAQELETVLPELVHESMFPAQSDAQGNEISPAVSYKSVNYIGLITIGLQATNELNAKVEEKDALIGELNKEVETLQAQLKNQETRLAQLESCLSALLPALCEMNQTAVEQNTPDAQQALKSQLQVILSDRNAVVLSQNVPNPFAESTVIQYSVPASVKQAQIHFYDNLGKLISSVDITERGNGELKVFASDLSSGMYIYTLVADGKIVTSKKMMKK